MHINTGRNPQHRSSECQAQVDRSRDPWLWAERWERALKNAWRRSASADLKRLYFEPDHRRDPKGRGRQ